MMIIKSLNHESSIFINLHQSLSIIINHIIDETTLIIMNHIWHDYQISLDMALETIPWRTDQAEDPNTERLVTGPATPGTMWHHVYNIYVYIHKYRYACIRFMFIHMYTQFYLYEHLCKYVHIYIYAYICKTKNTCIYIYMNVYV